MNDEENAANNADNPQHGDTDREQNRVRPSQTGTLNHQATPPDSGDARPRQKRSVPVRFWRALWRKRLFWWHRRSKTNPPNWAEIAGICIAAGIFLAACIQVGVYLRQADLMERGLNQNGDAIIVSKGQLAVAARNAKTAEDANNATKLQFRFDQRPYLSPTPNGTFTTPDGKQVWLVHGKSVKPPIASDWVMDVGVKMENVGHSPAVDARTTITKFIVGPKNEARRKASTYVPQYSVATTFIMSGVGVTATNGPYSLTDEQVQGFAHGTIEIYVVGSVIYRDIFSPKLEIPYRTQYCYQMEPEGMPFANCPWEKGFISDIK